MIPPQLMVVVLKNYTPNRTNRLPGQPLFSVLKRIFRAVSKQNTSDNI